MARGISISRHSAGLGLTLLLSVQVAAAQTPAPAALPDSANPVTQHTPNGLRYVVHTPGTGPQARIGSRVAVRYTGFLPDGHIFDTSVAWGAPLRFRVGRGEVIRGWDELLPMLAEGARVRAWVPATLAYGAKGLRDPDNNSRYLILPNTELVFEFQVLRVR